MDINNALEALGAISQSTRLDIFRLLIKAGDKGLAAGEIAEAICGRQNTTSTNLAILARSGLINAARDGRNVIYRADYAAMRDLIAFLLEDCCGGRPEICAPLLQSLSCLNTTSGACCNA
ncbi:MAG: metalloregulator ArsR/SmtB family transcription factor [Phyllobacterium sp.]|uniref:ArsR/SmtB family transcription factor n=1 Tax=Phyllobacterium sp. TaxID=1871046 RepID=UPI0030F12E32